MFDVLHLFDVLNNCIAYLHRLMDTHASQACIYNIKLHIYLDIAVSVNLPHMLSVSLSSSKQRHVRRKPPYILITKGRLYHFRLRASSEIIVLFHIGHRLPRLTFGSCTNHVQICAYRQRVTHSAGFLPVSLKGAPIQPISPVHASSGGIFSEILFRR